jgi:hypothetical protein
LEHIMKDNRRLPYPFVTLIVLSLFFLTGCGTLEIRIETESSTGAGAMPTATAPAAMENTAVIPAPVTLTPTAADFIPPTPRPAFTPVPARTYPAPAGLRVAYLQEGRVWLWTAEETEPVVLTRGGEAAGDVAISDDGGLVAYIRQEELWVVRSDGRVERPLVTAADLDAMGPDGSGVKLHRFAWIPGTHTLAFNTRLVLSLGQVLSHDLHEVDADTQAQRVLLPAGEGGEFYYSPDGSQVAVVTPNEIRLMDADGSNRRDEVLRYTPVATYSEYTYYAQPVWAADGSALRVVIPPADPMSPPMQASSLWHLPTDGSPARLITSVTVVPSLGSDALGFSSDLGFLAYTQLRGSESGSPEQVEGWLEVRRLGSEDVVAYPDASVFFGWAPDSLRFAFVTGRERPYLQIGQWSGPTVPGSLEAGAPVFSLRWVDADHYLLVTKHNWASGPGSNFDLALGDISGASTVLASTVEFVAYDFALAGGAAQP